MVSPLEPLTLSFLLAIKEMEKNTIKAAWVDDGAKINTGLEFYVLKITSIHTTPRNQCGDQRQASQGKEWRN